MDNYAFFFAGLVITLLAIINRDNIKLWVGDKVRKVKNG